MWRGGGGEAVRFGPTPGQLLWWYRRRWVPCWGVAWTGTDIRAVYPGWVLSLTPSPDLPSFFVEPTGPGPTLTYRFAKLRSGRGVRVSGLTSAHGDWYPGRPFRRVTPPPPPPQFRTDLQPDEAEAVAGTVAAMAMVPTLCIRLAGPLGEVAGGGGGGMVSLLDCVGPPGPAPQGGPSLWPIEVDPPPTPGPNPWATAHTLVLEWDDAHTHTVHRPLSLNTQGLPLSDTGGAAPHTCLCPSCVGRRAAPA